MLVDIITEEAHQIIQYNVRMISRLVAERKRFENWLQLEILTRLMEKFPAIEIEKAFPGTQERCDFWLKEQTGEESWIELKLCVTNYCSNYCEISSARPITNQISDIKRDLHKLHRLPTAHSRTVILIAYPFPDFGQTQSQWILHLARLKTTAGNVSEAFSVPLERNAKHAKLSAYLLSAKSNET